MGLQDGPAAAARATLMAVSSLSVLDQCSVTHVHGTSGNTRYCGAAFCAQLHMTRFLFFFKLFVYSKMSHARCKTREESEEYNECLPL